MQPFFSTSGYTSEEVWGRLFAAFRLLGYIRRPCPGKDGNPSDWELRFLCSSRGQVRELQNLLFWCGYPAPEPHRRYGKQILALPGRGVVECMEELWDLFAPGTRPAD